MKFFQLSVLVCVLLISPAAFAYLDPGSGSMLLQVVLGGVAAIGVATKLYWHRAKRALGFGSKKQIEE